MIEIEFVGTGGQGSVVAGKLFAVAAAKAGYKSQAFSAYGSRRRGGDVESYVRLSEDVILNHSKIYGADYVIVMDESLLESARKQGKVRKDATVVINTTKSPDEFPSLNGCKVVTLDANGIASRRGVTLPSGMPVINTTVLGALWAMIPSVKIDQLIESLAEGHIPALPKNVEAVKEAYAGMLETIKSPGKKTKKSAEQTRIVGEAIPEYHPRMSPCEANCPAGEKIERTALFIQNERFEDALASIMSENPFPGICGRVCFHPCETNCNRVDFDEGIATNALERAAFDFADSSKTAKPKKKKSTGKTVAVIGSGPAGLTAAHYLALLGHKVTVYESQPVAGGVPRFGIPEYHLPREIVDREVKQVADLGVDIKLSTKVGKDIQFDDIAKKYDAVFVAAGAHRSSKLGVPGEDGKGVLSGLDFLKRVALGEKVEIGKKVVVVGGGNVAMDVARTARRVGATEVHVVCLESRKEMPAYNWEIADAEAEEIEITPSCGPSQIVLEKGKVSAIDLDKCVSVFDAQGKFAPKYDKKTNLRIQCDTVLTAIGERVELPFADGTVKIAGPVIEVDDLGQTSKKGVFAGGDASSMSRSVVEAIASGKRAALGIDLYLAGALKGKASPFKKGEKGAVSMARYLSGDTKPEPREVVPYEKLNLVRIKEEPRVTTKDLPAKTRIKDFREAKGGFTRESAIKEAERCLHCGTCILCEVCYISCPDMAITLTSEGPTFSRGFEVCKSCGICLYECPRNAISWEGAAK